jgi:ABC-type dipeptide/oligopeptide/nickel transport system ATPase component
MVPPPGARGDGCSFAERCPAAIARCVSERPQLTVTGQDPAAACWNPAP